MMLLSIIAPPAMEDELIDWLLTQPNISGFTSQDSNGHGSGHIMSLAEQVTGRRRQITFWIELEKSMAESTLAELKQVFSGSGLHYWLLPLSESGSI
ncbi:MAG: DUF3240 domain-containing protein [Methylococcaceae bacterium]|nr:DUF3240 domain-containing protein [Methylococcaceae bacterium]